MTVLPLHLDRLPYLNDIVRAPTTRKDVYKRKMSFFVPGGTPHSVVRPAVKGCLLGCTRKFSAKTTSRQEGMKVRMGLSNPMLNYNPGKSEMFASEMLRLS